jgi:hypothetical protein
LQLFDHGAVTIEQGSTAALDAVELNRRKAEDAVERAGQVGAEFRRLASNCFSNVERNTPFLAPRQVQSAIAPSALEFARCSRSATHPDPK